MATRRNDDDDDLLSPRGARHLRETRITADDDWEAPTPTATTAGIPDIDPLADGYTVKGSIDATLDDAADDFTAMHQPKLGGLDDLDTLVTPDLDGDMLPGESPAIDADGDAVYRHDQTDLEFLR